MPRCFRHACLHTRDIKRDQISASVIALDKVQTRALTETFVWAKEVSFIYFLRERSLNPLTIGQILQNVSTPAVISYIQNFAETSCSCPRSRSAGCLADLVNVSQAIILNYRAHPKFCLTEYNSCPLCCTSSCTTTTRPGTSQFQL